VPEEVAPNVWALEAVLGAALDGAALVAELALAFAVDVVADCGAVAFFCPDAIAAVVFAAAGACLLPAVAADAGFVAELGAVGTLAFCGLAPALGFWTQLVLQNSARQSATGNGFELMR
jgi:hypothetical protein